MPDFCSGEGLPLAVCEGPLLADCCESRKLYGIMLFEQLAIPFDVYAKMKVVHCPWWKKPPTSMYLSLPPA